MELTDTKYKRRWLLRRDLNHIDELEDFRGKADYNECVSMLAMRKNLGLVWENEDWDSLDAVAIFQNQSPDMLLVHRIYMHHWKNKSLFAAVLKRLQCDACDNFAKKCVVYWVPERDVSTQLILAEHGFKCVGSRPDAQMSSGSEESEYKFCWQAKQEETPRS